MAQAVSIASADVMGSTHISRAWVVLARVATVSRPTFTGVAQAVSIASADAMGSTHISRAWVVLARVATVANVAAADVALALLSYAETVAAAGV